MYLYDSTQGEYVDINQPGGIAGGDYYSVFNDVPLPGGSGGGSSNPRTASASVTERGIVYAIPTEEIASEIVYAIPSDEAAPENVYSVFNDSVTERGIVYAIPTEEIASDIVYAIPSDEAAPENVYSVFNDCKTRADGVDNASRGGTAFDDGQYRREVPPQAESKVRGATKPATGITKQPPVHVGCGDGEDEVC
jgi:hypothetical protein